LIYLGIVREIVLENGEKLILVVLSYGLETKLL